MNTENSITVHITEHHPSVVAGYTMWLGKETDIKLLGTAKHPKEALLQFATMDELPTVLIMDYSYAEDDTVVYYLGELRQACPNAAIMIITGYDLPHVLRIIHRAGVEGLVVKNDGEKGFIQCVRAIAAGGSFYSQTVRKHVGQGLKIEAVIRDLSDKQKQVLLELASGQPDKILCDKLNVANSTLDNYRTAIYTKLRDQGYEVYSKPELVQWYNNHKDELSVLL